LSALSADECFRLIKPVEIGPLLPALHSLPWFSSGQSSAGKYRADVVLLSQFPPELRGLLPRLDLGGETARAVLRRLGPRQFIPPHTDTWMPQEADWRRFQLPLVTDPSVVMRWQDDGQEVHLAAGWLYEVRFDRQHEVVNGWGGQRIHLQIDQVNATL
jgi:hypothetical protein